MSFREDFAWGAATASYQIEGSPAADGKGPSVWDMMVRQPGRIWEGDTGDVACDHYVRWREDVALMREIGLKAYRLSLSWPRIIPDGTGAVSEKGLDFYDRLVDGLLEAGVRPWVTLFHWDFPYALFTRGGWLNPESPRWFQEYAAVVVDRLSDRVTDWMTLNEPQCFIGLGHGTGVHAPGLRLDLREQLLAGHHALLAHGLGVQTIRARAQRPPRVGWAPVGVIRYPATETPADIEAARRAMFEADDNLVWSNTWWADPPLRGHYPEDALRIAGASAPRFTDSEMATIHQPLDFYGANIYAGHAVRAGADGRPEHLGFPAGAPMNYLYWKVTPEVLYWGPRLLAERYGLPVVITENGISCHDWVSLDGRVRDPQRIDFVHRYLRELRRAAADGVDVRGYFIWTLMDNFEWAEGFRQRLGLIHVDFATQKRTLKDSARWYRRVIETNGAEL